MVELLELLPSPKVGNPCGTQDIDILNDPID
jgi:hypothetical protein